MERKKVIITKTTIIMKIYFDGKANMEVNSKPIN